MSLINVPSDGNCLLHSIALAFLDPTIHKEEFERRFEMLFGTGFEHECNTLYQQFKVNATDANLYIQLTNDQNWENLIDKFRINLVEFMKLKTQVLSNSANAVGYIPRNGNFYNTESFNKYLEVISESRVWLGSLEILAASLLLECCIIVEQQSKLIATFNEKSSLILTLAYLNDEKHYNFVLKCSPIPKQKRKSPMTEMEFNEQSAYPDSSNEILKIKRIKLDDDIEDYASSGLKTSLHGTVYQLELLMLFLLRINKLSEFFFLATEMDLAEKFDDVVLKYKMSKDSQYKWRFLQAKHKQDSTKHKITINDLKSSNNKNEFSLQKYYVSFYKITTNKKYFQDAKLEDFCILTNTNFDLEIAENDNKNVKESKQKWKNLFSKAVYLHKDKILYFDGEESQEVRFKAEPEELKELSGFIKSSLKIAISTDNKKQRDNLQSLEQSNLIPAKIKEEIKSSKIKSFSDSMLETILNIEKRVDKFHKGIPRDQFFKLADDILKIIESPKLVDIKDNLKKNTSVKSEEKEKYFKQLVEHLKEYIDQQASIDDWLQTSKNGDDTTKIQDLKEAFDHFDKYFPKFIKKLRFVTNYPDVDSLSLLISSEIGVDENLLTPDLFAASFEKVMLDWFKTKKSLFLSNLKSPEIRKKIQVKIHTLMVAGLSKAYPEKLSSYKISFKRSLSNISTFLQDTKVSILHLISTKTLLTSIKLLETLKDLSKFGKFNWLNRKDSFIFIQLESLLLPEIQKIAIDSFSSDLISQNLFIIECMSPGDTNTEYTRLFNRLGKQIKNNIEKKIILIGPEKDGFIKKFKNFRNIKIDEFNDTTYFSDLDETSQEKILSQQLVLQGKDIQLRDITDKSLANDLIDETFLVDLIKNESIIIGDVLKPYFNYNEQYYILRKLQHQKLKKSILCSELHLFISNITEEQLIELKAKKENLCRLEDYDSSKNVIFTDSNEVKQTQDYFNELYGKGNNQKSVHWIAFNKGYLEWKSSRGDVSKIVEYVDDESCSIISENSFKEDDVSGFNMAENLVIIADSPGMGKSTLMASVSLKIKENYPHWWVHVVNLNDYSDNNHPHALKYINFAENDLDTAVDYCSQLVLPAEIGRFENKFIQKLFTKNLLTEHLDKKLNVVLLFDGFDEIAPTFKRKTVKLLKSLRKTNIKQLWITTRLHIKQFLEIELGFPALVLNRFTNEDKTLFLNKFLRWHLKYREKDLERALSNLALSQITVGVNESNDSLTIFNQDILRLIEAVNSKGSVEYINYLIENLDPSEHSWFLLLKWQKAVTTRKEDITSSPLHLKMLADVTFQRNVDINDNFNILTLYRSFVTGTFDVFFKDKKTVGEVLGGRMLEISAAMNYKKIHQELALKFFMSHVKISALFSFLQNETDNFNQFNYGPNEPKIGIEQILVRIGLVLYNSGSELTFIHATIAEYFLFEWLISHLQQEQVHEIFVKVILLEGDYSLTCEFFEIFLDNPVQWQNTVFSEKLVHAISQNEIETYSNNTILHVATIRDHCNILNYLICNFKSYDVKYLRNVLIATDRQGRTALEVANLKKNVMCFKILINLNALYCKESLYFNLVSIFRNYFTQLDNEQKENDAIIFKDLILFAKRELCAENFKKLLSTPIVSTYSRILKRCSTCNILHVMVYFRQKSNLQFLIDELQNYPVTLKLLLLEKETCGEGLTPFYLALSKNYLEIINLFVTILQNNFRLLSCMILQPNNYGVTLQSKKILENSKSFKYLLNNIVQNLSSDEYDRLISSLILSCNCKKETIFSMLFNHNIENDVLVTLLNKLELQELCEDILLISIYFKGITPERQYKFLDWFQNAVLKSVHADNTMILEITENIKENISPVIEATKYFTEKIWSSTLNKIDTSSSEASYYSILKNRELLLSFKLGSCINMLDFLLHNCHIKIQESVLKYLCCYPNILRTIVLDTDTSGCTVLHKLTTKNKIAQIKILLSNISQFPDITENLVLKVNNNEETVAHLAVANADKEILDTMLNCAYSIDKDALVDLTFAVNKEKRNILELAIEKKLEDIVKLIFSFIDLLKIDDVVDLLFATYKHTENLVFFCLKTSSREICILLFKYIMERLERSKVKQLFLDSNHIPTIVESDYGNLTFAAAQQTEFVILDILCEYLKIIFNNDEYKKYILFTNPNKLNFLHTACCMGSSKNIKYFLEELRNSLNLDDLVSLLLAQNNSSGMTPLHDAVFHDQFDSLKVVLSFCENHLIHAYPNLINQLLLATEISDCTLLIFAAEKNSQECFTLVLSMAKLMEQQQAGIMEKLLLKTNLKGRNVLNDIIIEGRTEMLDELLETLDVFSMAVDELVLNIDNDGESILHVLMFSDEDLDNIKKIFAKLKYQDTILKIITKENKLGLTPLHKAYWNCDSTEDAYVQFLLDEMKQQNLDHQTLLKLQDASSIAERFETAIGSENLKEIQDVFKICQDCPRELFLMPITKHTSFLRAAYGTNNIDIVKTIFQFLSKDSDLLKHVLLSNPIQFPANFCDFDVFSLILEYARSLEDKEFYRHLLLENNVILVLKIKKGNKKIRNLLKGETNKIAESLLTFEGKSELKAYEYNYLQNLKFYVESNEFSGSFQGELVNILKAEISRRDHSFKNDLE